MLAKMGICPDSDEAGPPGTQDCVGMLGVGEQWEGGEAARL